MNFNMLHDMHVCVCKIGLYVSVAKIDVIFSHCREVETMMKEQDQLLKELVPQVRVRERERERERYYEIYLSFFCLSRFLSLRIAPAVSSQN